MPQPRTSIADLARVLHLAPSTVSRALSGHAQISASTQQRVRQTALELDYHPHPVAAALRKGCTTTLGPAAHCPLGGPAAPGQHSSATRATVLPCKHTAYPTPTSYYHVSYLHQTDGATGLTYLLQLARPPDAVFAAGDSAAVGEPCG